MNEITNLVTCNQLPQFLSSIVAVVISHSLD